MITTDTLELLRKNNLNAFTNALNNMSDLMKTYLFQVKFEFQDPTLTKYETDLMLRVNRIDVENEHITITFDEFQDLLVTKMYHTPAFRNSKMNIIVDCYDSTLHNCIGTFRYNNVTMDYEPHMSYWMDTSSDSKVQRKIIFNMSDDDHDIIMPTL